MREYIYSRFLLLCSCNQMRFSLEIFFPGGGYKPDTESLDRILICNVFRCHLRVLFSALFTMCESQVVMIVT